MGYNLSFVRVPYDESIAKCLLRAGGRRLIQGATLLDEVMMRLILTPGYLWELLSGALDFGDKEGSLYFPLGSSIASSQVH